MSNTRATDVSTIKLPEGNLTDVIVPELKQDVWNVAVPLIPKLPSELALLFYVPVKVLLVIADESHDLSMTGVDVRETLPPVKAPVRLIVISGSKQFEPSTCTAPLTELAD